MAAGHGLQLDRDGALRELVLYRSQLLLGVPCYGSGLVGTELRFHRGGSLARVVLAEAHAIDGVLYPRGTRLHLSPEGKVIRSRAVKPGPKPKLRS